MLGLQNNSLCANLDKEVERRTTSTKAMGDLKVENDIDLIVEERHD